MRMTDCYGWVVLAAGLALGCGPASEATETDGDTDTDTDGTAGSSGTGNSSLPDDGPNDDAGDVVDDAEDVVDDADDVVDDADDIVDDADDVTDDASDDACPPGAEDCPCDVGAQCDGDLLCDVESGLCVGIPACVEPEGEPNEDEDTAVDLGEVTCPSMSDSTFGALSGTDLDMFQFHGVDDFSCFSEPEFTVEADVDLRACIFFSCDDGDASATCPQGQEASTSPAGHPGCCGMNGAGFASRNCAGSFGPEHGTIYMRVGQSKTEMCLAYNIAYEF